MDYLFQDGGKPKAKKSKTTKSKTSTKTATKTGSKTTKSKTTKSKTGTKTTKSKTGTKKTGTKKGGNFLGTVGDLVAPTGWGPFATAAGLLALDRADSALRRGKSEKSSAKKGGMRGGNDIENLVSEYKEILKKIDYSKNEPHIYSFLFDYELDMRRKLRVFGESEEKISKIIKEAQRNVGFVPIGDYIDEFKKSYKKYKNGNNGNQEYEKKFRDILSTKFNLKKNEIDEYVSKFKSAVDNPY